MRWHVAFALLASTAAAAAPPVTGGGDAPQGAWPDAAAILYDQGDGQDAQGCTGTLIAPTVVLTAGHCTSPELGTLDHVLVGASSLAHPDEGETLPVRKVIAYPGWSSSSDVAVLVLGKAAHEPPRALATGWGRLAIVDGAPVELVGFGAIDDQGLTFVDQLQEARTTITDAACDEVAGCHDGARPAGELGAGGMGIDTCFGDSGGPLYVLTAHGALLAGVTSRGYADATVPCSQGGIYERPDKIADWIEEVAGVRVTRAPEPAAPAIEVVAGDGGETQIAANDPAGGAHAFALATGPAHGEARVRDDGRVRVCTDPAFVGRDAVTVAVTDRADPTRAVDVTIPIQTRVGAAPASCDVEAFAPDPAPSGGCGAAGGEPGVLALVAAAAALIGWRRRRPSEVGSGRGRDLAQV